MNTRQVSIQPVPVNLAPRDLPQMARVLIVDDEATNVEMLSRYLDRRGYSTLAAVNGQQALEKVYAQMPDIVVLDILMPVLDGFSVCHHLRKDFRTRGIPIILLTAKHTLNDRLLGFQAGADDFISKPYDLDELNVRIECALQRRRWDQWTHPLTHLPGSPAIEEHVRYRLAQAIPFAFAYIDIDNFKAYNDAYGYDAGDHVIKDVSQLLIRAASQQPADLGFPGHVGGDDFVLIALIENMRAGLPDIACQFDERRGDYYSSQDLKRGMISCKNRQGIVQSFPLMTLSIAVVSTGTRQVSRYAQLVGIASELKKHIKQWDHREKSLIVWDRRRDSAKENQHA